MAEFSMQIAGFTAAVTSLFESTPQYFRPYLTCSSPDFSVAVTREDLVFEQEAALAEARQEGFRVRIFPDPFLERAAIQRSFAEFLLSRDILLFHGSAIAVDGEGYLFTARSGTGKSTHTRLWREALGSRAVMINDDKPFLEFSPWGIRVWGSPWSGKHGLDNNICVPLKGVCILERGPENRICPLAAENAMAMLLHQSWRSSDAQSNLRAAQLVYSLSQHVPLWHMTCTKEPQAAAVAFAAMSQKAPKH